MTFTADLYLSERHVHAVRINHIVTTTTETPSYMTSLMSHTLIIALALSMSTMISMIRASRLTMAIQMKIFGGQKHRHRLHALMMKNIIISTQTVHTMIIITTEMITLVLLLVATIMILMTTLQLLIQQIATVDTS